MDIFNIHIEFNHDKFRKKIEQAIAYKHAGYVCVIDGNVLSQTYFNSSYHNIVCKAFVNTCDGGFIAKMCNDIYHTKYTAFNGPDIFKEFVEKPYTQLLIGNTQETYNKIINRLKKQGKDKGHLLYMPLPFAKIEEFNYEEIAKSINESQPQIIWVSLGAPKQEIFMNKLLPYLNEGVMFGIGAAFNYYAGILKEPKVKIGAVRMIWLMRLFEEPKKQFRRCWNFLRVIPPLFIAELRKKNQSNV